MEKEFIPYEIALALKELGFDVPCLASWTYKTKERIPTLYGCGALLFNTDGLITNQTEDIICSAPTFSQVFRWFRDKYNLHHSISILQRSCRYHFKIRTIECESDLKPFGDNKIIFGDGPRKKYEDIELECLKKLIEIVKNKN